MFLFVVPFIAFSVGLLYVIALELHQIKKMLYKQIEGKEFVQAKMNKVHVAVVMIITLILLAVGIYLMHQ